MFALLACVGVAALAFPAGMRVQSNANKLGVVFDELRVKLAQRDLSQYFEVGYGEGYQAGLVEGARIAERERHGLPID